MSRVDEHEPEPINNDEIFIKDLVINDIKKRSEEGLRRYKTYLQPNNGRDALMDAYQEALDLCAYLRQAIYERDRE